MCSALDCAQDEGVVLLPGLTHGVELFLACLPHAAIAAASALVSTARSTCLLKVRLSSACIHMSGCVRTHTTLQHMHRVRAA
eukprot:5458956-Pleurochrysis_carterae.AAC.4